MADQPYLSLQRFPGNGTTGPWEVNFAGNREDENAGVEPFIDPEDVRGYIVTPATSTTAEVQVPVDLIHEGPNTFSTTVPVPVGLILMIRRETEDSYSLVNYQRLQAVTAFDLDQANRQLLFLTQESVDRSQLAQEAAAEVRDLAQEAVATAEDALATANSAVDTADGAVATADAALAAAASAVADAAAAVTAAAAAVTTANEAADTANGVDAKAQAALDDAAAALALANDAMDLVTSAGVSSFNGRNGTVVPEAGDYDSAMIPHGAGTVQTALSSGASSIADLQVATTALQDAITALADEVDGKEPAIAAGNSGNYIRGDKTLGVFGTAVRTALLTGLSLADSTTVAASDTLLAAIGKLQAQIGNASPMFSVSWWPKRSTIPAGYIAADGQLLSRATYPTASSAILAGTVPLVTDANWLASAHLRGAYSSGDGSTTFRMPDLNGKAAGSWGAVFLRGDGAGSTESNGWLQRDAFQGHYHRGESGSTSGPATWSATTAGTGTNFSITTAIREAISDGTNGTPRTAAETRPLNATGCWVIKLFGAVTEAGSANAAQLASDYANLAGRTTTVEGKVAALEAGIKQTPELLWSGNAGTAGNVLTLSRPLQVGDIVWVSHTDGNTYVSAAIVLTADKMTPGSHLGWPFGQGGGTGCSFNGTNQLTITMLTSGYPIGKVYASRAKN